MKYIINTLLPDLFELPNELYIYIGDFLMSFDFQLLHLYITHTQDKSWTIIQTSPIKHIYKISTKWFLNRYIYLWWGYHLISNEEEFIKKLKGTDELVFVFSKKKKRHIERSFTEVWDEYNGFIIMMSKKNEFEQICHSESNFVNEFCQEIFGMNEQFFSYGYSRDY